MNCDTCDYHKQHELLIQQTVAKSDDYDKDIESLKINVSNLSLRNKMLLYVLSLLLASLISISTYGVVQFSKFLQTYQHDTLELAQKMHDLDLKFSLLQEQLRELKEKKS